MSFHTLPLLPAHWEHHRLRLRWELQQLNEGKMRTWADYGSGRLETTTGSLNAIKEQLAMMEHVLEGLSLG